MADQQRPAPICRVDQRLEACAIARLRSEIEDAFGTVEKLFPKDIPLGKTSAHTAIRYLKDAAFEERKAIYIENELDAFMELISTIGKDQIDELYVRTGPPKL